MLARWNPSDTGPSVGERLGDDIIPYRFLPEDDSVGSGIRRIACEQIDGALASIDDKEADRAKAVHDLRKRCKKLRGLVRLVRPAFRHYQEEDEAFRDIAGLFGGLRDAEVVRAIFEKLVEHHADRFDPSAIEFTRRQLTEAAAEDAAAKASEPFDEAGQRLSEARRRVLDWRLDDDGWNTPRRGLLKTYARARKAMKRAAEEPGGEHYHAWRKAVKYHWYHSRLLRAAWPRELRPRADLAFELSEVLGEYHDLFVMERHLADKAPSIGSHSADINEFARRRRAKLERRAFRLGKRLLGDRRDDLGSRLRDVPAFRS